MLYNNIVIGGVLVHADRKNHKYIDKIKTKAGKWRYIYKNTLNYKKNKANLDKLESYHTNKNVNADRNTHYDSKDLYKNLRENAKAFDKQSNFYQKQGDSYVKKAYDNYLDYANKNDYYLSKARKSTSYPEVKEYVQKAMKNEYDYQARNKLYEKHQQENWDKSKEKAKQAKQDRERSRMIKSEQRILNAENKAANNRRKYARSAVENSIQHKIKKSVELHNYDIKRRTKKVKDKVNKILKKLSKR